MENISRPIIDVVCAIIINNEKVLVAQRPFNKHQGGLWEFPGGKIHLGENAIDAIKREILEELCITIEPTVQLTNVIHHYENFSIYLIPFIAHFQSGELKPTEHINVMWLPLDKLKTVLWCEADIPIVEEFLLNYT